MKGRGLWDAGHDIQILSPKALDLVSKLVSVVCSVNAETAPGASGLEELIRRYWSVRITG